MAASLLAGSRSDSSTNDHGLLCNPIRKHRQSGGNFNSQGKPHQQGRLRTAVVRLHRCITRRALILLVGVSLQGWNYAADYFWLMVSTYGRSTPRTDLSAMSGSRIDAASSTTLCYSLEKYHLDGCLDRFTGPESG